MIDKYNRKINYLRVSITDRCNLRCLYCMPKEGLSHLGHDDILRYEEILRIVRETVKMGVSKIRITGGEPLVRRGVVDFIDTLRHIEGLDDISLTTNGILLENYAKNLFHAGIKRINISLDSLNKDKYASITRGGDLTAVLRGVNAVQDLGYSPIKINVVVVKGLNDDEILDFAELTLDKPYQIRFIELMPLGNAHIFNYGKYLSNDIIREQICSKHQLEELSNGDDHSSGPARMYRIPGSQGEIGFISPVSHDFCNSCNRLRLTADGHLRTCLLSDEETDIRTLLRNNCKQEELAKVIQEAVAKKPLRHGDMHRNKSHTKKCLKEMSAIGG